MDSPSLHAASFRHFELFLKNLCHLPETETKNARRAACRRTNYFFLKATGGLPSPAPTETIHSTFSNSARLVTIFIFVGKMEMG
jgi:hypothetical protein